MAAPIPAGGLLFAQLDPALFVPTMLFIGALLIGAVIVAFVRRWQQVNRRFSPSASDQLAEFRSLYERGQMTEEEFNRVRGKLNAEIRKAMDLPAPLPPPGEPAPVNPNATAIQPAEPGPPPGDQPPPETGIRPS